MAAHSPFEMRVLQKLVWDPASLSRNRHKELFEERQMSRLRRIARHLRSVHADILRAVEDTMVVRRLPDAMWELELHFHSGGRRQARLTQQELVLLSEDLDIAERLSDAGAHLSLWVFGYGSLIWRPAFHSSLRVVARLRGWKRRFYQGSPDHRGTLEAPGRVVTLLPEGGAEVWGVAYKVEGSEAMRVRKALDVREAGGYDLIWTSVEPELDHPQFRVPPERRQEAKEALRHVATYIATERNPHYLGEASEAQIAEHVMRHSGPSGPNLEYLVELDRALVSLGHPDPHVREIAKACGH